MKTFKNLMTFGEALTALKQGQKIVNYEWTTINTAYYYLKDNHIYDEKNKIIYCLPVQDILSDNWGVVCNILDKEEKEYLSAVIKPFKIKCITKSETTSDLFEFITICLDNEEDELITLPYFKKGTMYKNMETDKNYTIEELEL